MVRCKFCASLLRAEAVEAGIDPRFRVLDGAQAGTLLFELSDEVLRVVHVFSGDVICGLSYVPRVDVISVGAVGLLRGRPVGV